MREEAEEQNSTSQFDEENPGAESRGIHHLGQPTIQGRRSLQFRGSLKETNPERMEERRGDIKR